MTISFNCKNVKKDISIKEEIKLKQEKKETSYTERKQSLSTIDTLPIGLSEIMNEDFQIHLDNEEDYKKYKSIFDYYDLLYKKKSIKLDEEFHNLSYAPKKTSILDRDKHPLLGDEENEKKLKVYSFKTIKKLPKIGDLQILILSGKTPYNEYNKINRMDLVILNKELKIINEFNLYYTYASEISTKQKFFLIDQDYNIHIRYYFEKEGKSPYFSDTEKYMITNKGNILDLKN